MANAAFRTAGAVARGLCHDREPARLVGRLDPQLLRLLELRSRAGAGDEEVCPGRDRPCYLRAERLGLAELTEGILAELKEMRDVWDSIDRGGEEKPQPQAIAPTAPGADAVTVSA